jgi:hypothetical protein
MKKLILTFLTFFSFLLMGLLSTSFVTTVNALAPSPTNPPCPPNTYCDDGCTYVGQCINNRLCANLNGHGNDFNWLGLSETRCGSYIVGKIKPPIGVDVLNSDGAQADSKIGIIVFFSRVLNIFTIVAGLWVMMNFIMGGFQFVVGAGNSETMGKVRDKLIYSLVGLVIIVAAYSAAGVIGLIFFDDASFILNPDINKYSALAP